MPNYYVYKHVCVLFVVWFCILVASVVVVILVIAVVLIRTYDRP